MWYRRIRGWRAPSSLNSAAKEILISSPHGPFMFTGPSEGTAVDAYTRGKEELSASPRVLLEPVYGANLHNYSAQSKSYLPYMSNGEIPSRWVCSCSQPNRWHLNLRCMAGTTPLYFIQSSAAQNPSKVLRQWHLELALIIREQEKQLCDVSFLLLHWANLWHKSKSAPAKHEVYSHRHFHGTPWLDTW